MALVAVDFDHTLVDGKEPLAYAREAINILREHGHKILIFSCNQTAWIEKVLRDNDIHYDYIFNDEDGKKPNCDLFIDDRGYRFLGDWKSELPIILNILKPKPKSIAHFASGLQLDDED